MARVKWVAVVNEISFPILGISTVRACPAVREITVVSWGRGGNPDDHGASAVVDDQLAEFPVAVAVRAVVKVIPEFPPQSPLERAERSRSLAAPPVNAISLMSMYWVVADVLNVAEAPRIMFRAEPSAFERTCNLLVTEFPVRINAVLTVMSPLVLEIDNESTLVVLPVLVSVPNVAPVTVAESAPVAKFTVS